MHQGQKVLLDTPKALLADHIEDFVLELTENETDPAELRNQIPETVRIDPSGHGVRFYADDIDALKSF
jgi:hypothetical protein